MSTTLVQVWTGRETRALREAGRMSIVHFAARLGVSDRLVSKWEQGGTKIRPRTVNQEALDTLLEQSSPGIRSRFALMLRTAVAAVSVSLSEDPREETSDSPPLARRTVLQAGVTLGAGLGLARSASKSVDPAIVDRLVAVRSSLVAADSLLGPGRLIASAHEQVTNISEIIGRSAVNVRTKLFEVGALFAEFSGWLSDDAGETEKGRDWTRLALEWAETSGNDDLVSYTLMRMSQQALLGGEAGVVGPLADAALRRGRNGSVNVKVLAAASQQAAFGHALDRDEKGALTRMDQAMGLADQESEKDAYDLAEYCTPDYVNAQQGLVLGILGQHQKALAAYDNALQYWPSEYRRERGLHLARKAQVATMAGEADCAIDAGDEALEIALDTGSTRTLAVLSSVAAEMNKWASSDTQVREFIEHMTESRRSQGGQPLN